jgi:hypothetical protein
MDIVVTGFHGIEPNLTSHIGLSPQARFKASLQSLIWMFADFNFNSNLYYVYSGDRQSGSVLCDAFNRCSTSKKVIPHYHEQRNYDVCRGKGFLELLLLRSFLQETKLESPFIKITSKYVVKNFENVYNFAEKRKHLAGWRLLSSKSVDTRCVILDRKLLDNKNMELVNDESGYFFEHAVYDSLPLELRLYFNSRPIIEGLSGTAGGATSQGYIKQIAIRSLNMFVKI